MSTPFASWVRHLCVKQLCGKNKPSLTSPRIEPAPSQHRSDHRIQSYQQCFPQPKYRLGHPENQLFLLSKKIFSGSKYPKNNIFKFEYRSTDYQCRAWFESLRGYLQCTGCEYANWGQTRTHPQRYQHSTMIRCMRVPSPAVLDAPVLSKCRSCLAVLVLLTSALCLSLTHAATVSGGRTPPRSDHKDYIQLNTMLSELHRIHRLRTKSIMPYNLTLQCDPVLLSSNLHIMFFGYFDPENIFFIQ